MAHLRYEDGTLVAVSESETDYEMRLAARDVTGSLKEIGAFIGERLRDIAEGFRSGPEDLLPAEATLEMGIELEASTGLPVIVKADMSAHSTVTATWDFRQASGMRGATRPR